MSRDWRQARVGAGVEGTLGSAQARAWVLAYDGVFSSPGVLREDDLAAGEVGFYDAYPGSGGGHSTRVLGAASIWGGDARRVGRVTAWAGYRALSLQQNFTGWYFDEERGDGTLQRYEVGSFGASARAVWLPSNRITLKAGLQARLDLLEQCDAGVELDGLVWEERDALSGAQSDLGGGWRSLSRSPHGSTWSRPSGRRCSSYRSTARTWPGPRCSPRSSPRGSSPTRR
jgi:hypothetical protein